MSSTGHTCPVAHPYGQLQLELTGVPPLDPIQLVENRRSAADPRAPASISDELEISDARTREGRAARMLAVQAIRRPYETRDGWLVVGGEEALWLYYEGLRTFVSGEYLAALLCLHSACERAIAAAVSMDAPELEAKMKRWGLGKLADESLTRNLISEPMFQRLGTMTKKRNATAHFRLPLDPGSITYRTFYGDTPSQDVGATLEADAKEAVQVTTDLLGGGVGMGGAIGSLSD